MRSSMGGYEALVLLRKGEADANKSESLFTDQFKSLTGIRYSASCSGYENQTGLTNIFSKKGGEKHLCWCAPKPEPV